MIENLIVDLSKTLKEMTENLDNMLANIEEQRQNIALVQGGFNVLNNLKQQGLDIYNTNTSSVALIGEGSAQIGNDEYYDPVNEFGEVEGDI